MELDPRLRPSAPIETGPHSSSTPSASLNVTTGPSPTQPRFDGPSTSSHVSYTAEASSAYHNAGGAALTPPSAATTIGPTGAESTADNNDPLADLKRPRACEACRQLKVRCDLEPNHPTGSCKRCAKANRLCVVTAPTRKRQKKSDSRVAELERKIDALTESLHASRARNHGPGATSEGDKAQAASVPDRPSGRLLGMALGNYRAGSRGSNNDSGVGNACSFPGSLIGQKRQSNGEVKRYQSMGILGPLARPSSPTGQGPSTAKDTQKSFFETIWPSYDTVPKAQENEYMDVIDRGIVDVETATKAFNRYTRDMAPLMPFVVFPESTTMADVRRTKPILFLTILSVAIPVFAPSLQMPLVNEAHRVFADRAIVRGQKTLELVQAILIACMWYTPPEHFEEMKFYQLIHLAAVIGMELGMNRRSEAKSKTSNVWKEIMGRKFPTVAPDCLEARRAWVGCYFMSVRYDCSLVLFFPRPLPWPS